MELVPTVARLIRTQTWTLTSQATSVCTRATHFIMKDGKHASKGEGHCLSVLSALGSEKMLSYIQIVLWCNSLASPKRSTFLKLFTENWWWTLDDIEGMANNYSTFCKKETNQSNFFLPWKRSPGKEGWSDNLPQHQYASSRKIQWPICESPIQWAPSHTCGQWRQFHQQPSQRPFSNLKPYWAHIWVKFQNYWINE